MKELDPDDYGIKRPRELAPLPKKTVEINLSQLPSKTRNNDLRRSVHLGTTSPLTPASRLPSLMKSQVMGSERSDYVSTAFSKAMTMSQMTTK